MTSETRHEFGQAAEVAEMSPLAQQLLSEEAIDLVDLSIDFQTFEKRMAILKEAKPLLHKLPVATINALEKLAVKTGTDLISDTPLTTQAKWPPKNEISDYLSVLFTLSGDTTDYLRQSVVNMDKRVREQGIREICEVTPV